MDSPQKKAGSTMDGDGETLPVSVTVDKKATAASRPTLFPDAVRLVSIWTLFTACLFLCSFAIAYATNYAVDSLQCVDGDDLIWMMYCPALQAAAAALALLLPGHHRRVRRALAYLALGAAIAGHYMLVTAIVILSLDLNPEPFLFYLFARVCCTVTIVVIASLDLVSFMALLMALVSPGSRY